MGVRALSVLIRNPSEAWGDSCPERQLWVTQKRLQGKCSQWASLVVSNFQQSLTPNASVGPVGAGFPQHSPELAEPPELILTSFLP